MSELSNQFPEMPAAVQPSSPKKPESPASKEPPYLPVRPLFITVFLLFVGVTILFTPQIAKKIAYSWNIGIEQAKAEVARQFLGDNPTAAAEQRTAWVAKAVAPSVVGIHVTTSKPPDEYSIMRGGRGGDDSRNPDIIGADIGSGVIVDPQGYILTNYHVIDGAYAIRVQLSDGRIVEANIAGQDQTADIAVLRIDAEDLEAIEWGDSRQVAVGERVLAVGSPYNLQQTITSGIVSATQRYDTALLGTRGMRRGVGIFPYGCLQTDAAINPGNSGGALVDMNGKLIGICTAIVSSDNGGNSGIGFAIPSFTVQHFYKEIILHGGLKHGWIGIYHEDVSWYDAQQMGAQKPKGAFVRGFPGRSPAREAGLRSGDIILKWGETEITESRHLVHLVMLTEPGTKQTVEVFRGGELLTFEITVGSRPAIVTERPEGR